MRKHMMEAFSEGAANRGEDLENVQRDVPNISKGLPGVRFFWMDETEINFN